MTSILGRIFRSSPAIETRPVPDETRPVPDETPPVPDETPPVPDETPPVPDETPPVPDRYDVAMADSDALLARMRSTYASKDAVRQVLADIWHQHHNIPYSTTVFESVQELNAAVAYPERRGK